MPDKPTWYGRVEEIRARAEALPDEWVDRETVEALLGVGRRRAQQILGLCGARAAGSSYIAGRAQFLAYLADPRHTETAEYERRRRNRLARTLADLDRRLREQPRLLVEAPATTATSEFPALPSGITVEPGRIVVTFGSPQEALEKLLALAMAAGNDLQTFERLASTRVDE